MIRLLEVAQSEQLAVRERWCSFQIDRVDSTSAAVHGTLSQDILYFNAEFI
jgi:hypothetical protein